MKILIVDDKEENLYMLESLLKGSGYEVASAKNGAEALERLKKEPIDMIISDILMPVMDGFQLCRECKVDPELKDIPLVFYTATYTDERDEDLALKMGADRYVRKPLEPDKFLEIIQDVIGKRDRARWKKPSSEKEEDIFKLYSERLVNKLEKKMLDLEEVNRVLTESEEKLRRNLHALNERVKELNCLYGLSKLVETPGISLEGIFNGEVNLIPLAWEYPDITCARIVFGDKEYKNKNFKKTKWMQSADIVVDKKKAGSVDVCYLEKKPDSDEGPFLKEERDLLEAIAERLGRITERTKAEEKIKIFAKGFDESPNSMLLIDYKNDEPHILHVNISFTNYYGYKETEVMGKNPNVLKSGKQDKNYYKKIWSAILDPKIGFWRDEIVNKRKDGNFIDVILNITTIFDRKGKPDRFVAVHMDITERKKVEDELRKRNIQLEKFAKLTIGREDRMLELKKRIREMEGE